ncbi:hypothetical protein MTO96_026868 [Rhipicephalus appendiculatus]
MQWRGWNRGEALRPRRGVFTTNWAKRECLGCSERFLVGRLQLHVRTAAARVRPRARIVTMGTVRAPPVSALEEKYPLADQSDWLNDLFNSLLEVNVGGGLYINR